MASVNVIAAVILWLGSLMQSYVLPDCESFSEVPDRPCYTVDEGWERVVLSYDPYSYVNLRKVN